MILSPQEKRFLAYALHFLGSNLDHDNLEDLGLARPDKASGSQEEIRDHQAEQLCADLLALAAKIESQ
jgi:hypothetical protein